ncbi:MAG TPA: PfaD family polyunsaturated fatty acid/polyketide biosynthesis protein [Trebonia sp.]
MDGLTSPEPRQAGDPLPAALAAVERPFFLVRAADGSLTVTDDQARARSLGRVLLGAPPCPPRALGDPAFLRAHGVAYPYMSGAMANGIASAALVTAMARAGFLASFGAAGLLPDRIDAALDSIARDAPGLPFACNLIHSPSEPALESGIVDACLRHQVRCVEASAFLRLTAPLVRYRVAGLTERDGRVVALNRVIAKVSRTEVAEEFLRPAPEALLRELVAAGVVTAAQAELARRVPMADDITAEADSGGHTDRRPLVALVPEIIRLRDQLQRELGYPTPVRVGAAGGIGTPHAVFAAFALGAAYVVTGSVNQASVEADQSPAAKELLAAATVTDCDMAPAADMFEIGADVQVLRRGSMFAARARQLREVYRRCDGIDAIDAAERTALESRVFRRPLEEIWAECVRYFSARDPSQIARAAENPKRQMALIFRWYLGLSSGWSISGNPDRVADYQVWCGPAMGAFNAWAAGSYLAPVRNRQVADIARHLMRGAAVAARAAHLRTAGVVLPSAAADYRPAPLPDPVPAPSSPTVPVAPLTAPMEGS